MNSDIELSLCIPTNGVIEWVIPVLDSIYAEKNPIGRYEVIITDNGANDEFERVIREYVTKHENLIYKRTEAVQFLNQIEAFKLANGKLIKFINHRTMLMPGALNLFIAFAQKYQNEKPDIFFSNSSLALPCENNTYFYFDEYVKALSYFSSWSGGTAMWKSDFEKMDMKKSFNSLFPHIDMVLGRRDKAKYIINDQLVFKELPVDAKKKGRYDLFHAFAVEYINIIRELYESGDITEETYEYIKRKNRKFIASLYLEYVVRRKPCSYDLSGYEKAINVYYSDEMIKKELYQMCFTLVWEKIFRFVRLTRRKYFR